MRQYHIMVWSISFVLAVITGVAKQAHGFYNENVGADSEALCWVNEEYSSAYPVLIYYVPLLLIYTFSIGTLVIAYLRLRNGISQTIAHRIKALIVNTINLTINMFYWLVIAIFYFLSKGWHVDAEARRGSFQTLVYFGAAKGFTSVLAWILTINTRYGKEDVRDDEGVDLNSALRHEVLYYATKGIQNSCLNFTSSFKIGESKSRFVIKLEQDDSLTNDGFAMTLRFLVRLILGYEEESQQIVDIVRNKHHHDGNDSSPSQAQEDILRTTKEVQALILGSYMNDQFRAKLPIQERYCSHSLFS